VTPLKKAAFPSVRGNRGEGLKLAVTGKGGVGKTTVSALLAHVLKENGHDVIAIDADPDSNLLACMGYSDPDSVQPLVDLKSLIEERTGVKPGTTGGMFRLNPLVDDIPGTYAVEVDGARVLVAGAVKKGGTGCYCPENSLLRALISHLLLDKGTALVLDMEAGVEHLGRGTVNCVDFLVVVVNPGRRSVETAARIKRMASDIGLDRLVAVGNMVRSEDDKALLREALPGVDFAAFIPFDESVRNAEIGAIPLHKASGPAIREISEVVRYLETNEAGGNPSQE